MCRKPFCLASLVLVLALTTSVAVAGVEFGDPDGGWTYVYTGDAAAPGADFTALDGTWNHDNGSDQWDESEIGSGSPGGVSVLTEGAVTFARLQDTGDPSDYSMPDPSNRKLYFSHRMSDDGILPTTGNTILDDGVTISFRARLATTPPLDDLHPDGGGGTSPWPAGGNGYTIHHGGKGNFCVHQGEAEANGQIAFSLILAGDEQGGAKNPDRSGLCMPNLNGNSISGDIDLEGNDDGTLNLLDIDDLTIWHEFWITIEADATNTGTHLVKIYMDGSTAATEFIVTASNETENAGDGPNIGLAMGSTSSHGAFDVDFFAYKSGIIPPAPSNPSLARAVNPTPGATVPLHEATPFGWMPGETAVQHDVYLGTEEADVNDADITDTTGIYRGRLNVQLYAPPEGLELGGNYYWRIDEVEVDGTTIHKGSVWSFTVIDYLPVDDFEDYTDDDAAGQAIWQTWIDGFGVAENGGQAGYLVPPYAERTIVNSGSQSMPFIYSNVSPALYSEAVMTLSAQRDWTEQDVKALSLWFRGAPRISSISPGRKPPAPSRSWRRSRASRTQTAGPRPGS